MKFGYPAVSNVIQAAYGRISPDYNEIIGSRLSFLK